MRSSILLLVLALSACAHAPVGSTVLRAGTASPTSPASSTAARDVAMALAEDLAAARYAPAWARLDDAFQGKFTAERLGEQFASLSADLGPLQRVVVSRERALSDSATSVFVRCEYEHAVLPLVVTVDDHQRVAGLRPDAPSHQELATAARQVVERMMSSQSAEVVARFDATMRQALPEQQLASIVASLTAENGEFREIVAVRAQPGVVDVDCAFAQRNLRARIAFDGRLQVSGLFFLDGWNPPEYGTGGFAEQEVTVGTAALPLPGTLSLPMGEGPFPAVVLVHGSGPNDRDESIGPNKIFKDFAWGLASQGVAVLRYEKRTEQYRGELKAEDVPTVKEESIDDARSAVELLLKAPGVDPQRVFVLGHSLGANLAPRIAQAEPGVHGLVMLAGPTRTEGRILVDQTKYLVGPWGVPADEAARLIAEAEQSAARLDSPDLAPDEIVNGIAGSYWIDRRDHAGEQIAPSLELPMLVLQGERDYQVTMVDFEGWRAALQGKANATFKSYPALNHHFMPGEGPSVPREYDVPNHVAQQVVDDIAAWVQRH